MGAYENLQKVKEEIENRRLSALAQADMRNIEVREKSEVIREIDRELELTGPMLFGKACRGEDIRPLMKKNMELMQKRKQELVKLGYPEDYTEVHYFCKKCSDTGYINGTKRCSCMKEAFATENIKTSGIGKLIERQSFENFDVERYKDSPKTYEQMSRNLKDARRFAATFNIKGDNLLLIGGTGTGKTHISTAIAKEAIIRGFDVVYDSVQNVVSDFETDHFKSGYGPYEPKGDKYLDCDLLILDDLGSEFISTFSISCLYNILNTRQNRGLSTVVSTNLDPKSIAVKYEDRIYSRLIGSGVTILKFDGTDQRLH